jgi:hypothetical protein
MREVPDATGDLQVFWDDLHQFVFGNFRFGFFGLHSKTTRIGKPLLFWLNKRNANHTLA